MNARSQSVLRLQETQIVSAYQFFTGGDAAQWRFTAVTSFDGFQGFAMVGTDKLRDHARQFPVANCVRAIVEPFGAIGPLAFVAGASLSLNLFSDFTSIIWPPGNFRQSAAVGADPGDFDCVSAGWVAPQRHEIELPQGANYFALAQYFKLPGTDPAAFSFGMPISGNILFANADSPLCGITFFDR